MNSLTLKSGLFLILNLVAPHAFASLPALSFAVKPPVHSRRPLPSKPLALIYKGLGSCSKDQDDAGDSGFGCSEASAVVARLAGFQYKYVGPNDSPDFSKAKVWIQPGGISNVAYDTMSDKLKENLIGFIAKGGGYVGFCAGAFIATEVIGGTGEPGLGIFPGSTAPYDYDSARDDVGYGFLPIKWNGKSHKVYFEGGPYLYGQKDNAQITGYFADGSAVSGKAQYGKGRVYVTGAHPEAPPIWSREDKIRDPDGSDYPLAVEMIRWSAGLIK